MTIPSFEELMGIQPRQDTTRRTTSGGIPSFDELMGQEPIGSILGFSYTEDEMTRHLREAENIANRVKNISRLVTGAANLLAGRPDPEIVRIFTEGQKMSVEGNQLVKRDIANMFSQADIKETIKNLWEGSVDRIKNRKMETISALADMPGAIIESLIGDTFAAVTGVGLDGEEIRVLKPEEYAHSTKIFIGNAVAAVVAPATSKLVEATFAIPANRAIGGALTTANIEGASLAQQMALANTTPMLGKLGRAIVDDVTAGAMSGMAQGLIANANTPDTYAAAATGLLFAPIGVATGWYRGVKGTGHLEDAITQAKDIATIRQWQELGDANIESAARKVEALLTSDDIAQALHGGIHKDDIPNQTAILDTKTGQIHTGNGHFEILGKLEDDPNEFRYIDGFVTPKGEFLNRQHAFIRMDAYEKFENNRKVGYIDSEGKYYTREEAEKFVADNSDKLFPLKSIEQLQEEFAAQAEHASQRVIKKDDKYVWIHDEDEGVRKISREEYEREQKPFSIKDAEWMFEPDEKGSSELFLKPVAPKIPSIDDLWNDFKTRLTEDESFESTLVRYAEEKKLVPHLNEMLEKFATKFVEENVEKADIDHLRQLIKDNREAMGGKFAPKTHGDILDVATKHGFFLTNEFGKLKIRDIESGEVVGTANTSAEAIAIMNETGSPANPIKMDAGSGIPTDGIPTTHGPSINPHPGDDFEPVTNNWQKRVTAFDIGFAKAITSMNAFIEGIDLHFGTNLKHNVFEPIERSHRMTNQAIRTDLESGRMRLISALARKMSNEELEHIGMALESQTFDEILAPNGYSNGFTVSPQAATVAKFAHENNVDLTKVLYFRRAQSAIRYYFNNQAESVAFEQMKLNKQVGMNTAEAAEIFDQAVANVEKNPQFQEMMAKLFQTFSPDQNFIKAAGMIDDLFKAPDGAANTAATVRLKLALDHPDSHGLSRNDYVARYLKPNQVALLEQFEDAYKYFGERFGIPDARMINRYMNHYRQFGDILDSYVIGDFERGIMDGAMRQFVSAMIRTGEVAQYSMNPVLNLTAYIRGGNKAQLIYRTLEETVNKVDSVVSKEMDRVNDPVVRDMLRNRLNQYQRDVTGQHSVGDTEAMHIAAKMYSNLMKSEDGTRLTTNEIITLMQRPDHIDTFMALSSAGLLGGRISLALRDKYDVMQKFFVKYGPKRLGQLLFTKADKKAIEYLVDTGEITRPDPIDIYNVTYTQGASGTASRVAKQLADVGFQTSLQGYFYMKNQAAVYNHTFAHVGKVLNSKISREAMYKAVDLNRFDVATQRMFDAYVRDGMNESAARLLARQDVREIVGTFQRGNQAPVLNSKIGKIFGQLGSWGMTNRSVLQNLLTRGTKRDRMVAAVRYGTTVAATWATGRALGLNLGRWAFLPTSVIATGGPVLSLFEAFSSSAASELGMSEKQTRFTRRELQRSLMQFMPFGMAIDDMRKAVELQTQGQGFGAGRTAAQAIGIPVNTEDRNFMDYVIGNYPIKWEE